MNKIKNIFCLALLLIIILCSCSVSNKENSSSTFQSQTEVKGRLSNPYEKDETVEINTEERSWYNIVRNTTSTYGSAQLEFSIVEDIFSMSGTIEDGEGKKTHDSCVMIGICIEAVSIPDDVDYITYSDYINGLSFLTSDKREVSPNLYWSASYDTYIDMYNDAKNNGHINNNYYIDIGYREQKLYEGGKLYLLLGGLCSRDFGISSPDELEFLAITTYDKDSNPITVYISMK